jgi:hypothetical protein
MPLSKLLAAWRSKTAELPSWTESLSSLVGDPRIAASNRSGKGSVRTNASILAVALNGVRSLEGSGYNALRRRMAHLAVPTRRSHGATA